MEDLKNNGAIKQKIFSFYITDYFKEQRDKGIERPPDDGSFAKGSRLIIGGYDLEKYARPNSTVHWQDLSITRYWGVNVANFRAVDGPKGTVEDKIHSYSTTAIFDSGTSYILIPSYDFAQLL